MRTRVVSLGDVLLGIETGRSPKTLEVVAAADEPGVLKVSAVSWGAFDPQAAKAMPAEYVPLDSHRVRKGDLLLSRANTLALVGAVAISPANFPNRILSDKLLRLRVDPALVLPEFLLFALRTATARVHIEEQADTADLLRTRFLAGAFGAPPIGVRAADKAQPGWRIGRLTELARLESGHTPSRGRPEWWGGDVSWLALPDIRKLHGKFAYETTENTNDAGLKNSSARLLPVGTVCVSRTASIGFVTMLGKPMATSQDFCNWVCDPQTLDAEFLMYAFMASRQHLRELGSGAVHKTIYMPTIQSFHLCAPALAEQRRIASRLRDSLAAAEALSTHLRERQAEIAQLPRRLLAAAFEPVA